MIFSPKLSRCSISSTAMLDVTTQSARAFTAADVLAYTTTVRSGCESQNALNASIGQPRSKEHSACSVGIKMVFSGLRILAVSPINRTPATSSVEAECFEPNRAISSESEMHPPVSSASCWISGSV
ncbi:hypothetical protein D3C73_1397960 [compost metagenome]